MDDLTARRALVEGVKACAVCRPDTYRRLEGVRPCGLWSPPPAGQAAGGGSVRNSGQLALRGFRADGLLRRRLLEGASSLYVSPAAGCH
ncbi:hypothetical protein GCM10010272_67760 [Streptomyces lateritius]|nr:hypothetical protein GCM10010272_67760 [Streptomyces lateritius]